jgi:hypothetical protein
MCQVRAALVGGLATMLVGWSPTLRAVLLQPRIRLQVGRGIIGTLIGFTI